MRKLTTVAALVLTAATHRPAAAQATLAGTWNTEFDTGIRNENGVEMSMGKRKATITIILKGDSVFGTWQPAPGEDGTKPAALHLAGVRAGAKITLKSDPVERTVRMNDDEQRIKLVTSYAFEMHDDALEGTTRVAALDGSFESPDRPFSAKRAKD